MVVLGGEAVSYERGTPEELSLTTFQPEADKGSASQFELEVLEGSKRLKTATTDIVEEISAFLHSFGFSEVPLLRAHDLKFDRITFIWANSNRSREFIEEETT